VSGAPEDATGPAAGERDAPTAGDGGAAEAEAGAERAEGAERGERGRGAPRGAAGLVVVATPIGNLEDLSPRAARHLRGADLIAAEDTRSVLTLLRHADAGGPVNPERRIVSFFEGNEAARSEALVVELAAGRRVVVVSEAGTPGVSDPGERLVRAAAAAGIRVEVVPGPCAAIAALVASGLPGQRFTFLGFPPREAGARRELFGGLRGDPATLLFYESPERIADTIEDLAAALGGERRASLSREITKVHEEHRRGTLIELAASLAAEPARGECTLVVEGQGGELPEVDVEAELRKLLDEGLGPKDAAARLVLRTGKPRRHLYQLALSLRPPRG
jgi:16S rRNA (cytidine1402-2'-O)-methyltransferase